MKHLVGLLASVLVVSCSGLQASSNDAGGGIDASTPGLDAPEVGSDAGVGDAGTDAPQPGALTIEPPSIVVPAGRNQIFVASAATASWSVVENGGGSIDADGRYLAPDMPGTYHVIATVGAELATATVKVEQKYLSVLAGGIGGPGNLDGVGAAARLSSPVDVVYDGAGTLFIADSGSGTIRELDIATNTIRTLAGGARRTSTDGIGTSATFVSPTALAYDPSSHVLYVSDSLMLRRVDVVSRAVTTLAGQYFVQGTSNGIGSAATFRGIDSMCLVGTTLYMSESYANTIRTMDTETREVKLFAGSSTERAYVDSPDPLAARFAGPRGIACNATTMYVADFANYAIRTIDLSSGPTHGTVATLAGGHVGGTFDGTFETASVGAGFGMFLDSAGGKLYLSQWTVPAVRELDLANRQVTTIAGGSTYGSRDGIGSDAELVQPTGLTSDGTTLWIADNNNNNIRAIDLPTRQVVTLAGRASSAGTNDGPLDEARLYMPMALAFAPTGDLYVADYTRIRTISLAQGTMTARNGQIALLTVQDGTRTTARFNVIRGLAVDDSGELWVSDLSGAVRDAAADGAVTSPYGALNAHGYVDAPYDAARFGGMGDVAFVAGKLIVVDTQYMTLRAIDLSTGQVTTLAGSPGVRGATDGIGSAARFDQLFGITTDGVDHVWVGDWGAQTIREIEVSTGTVTTIAGSPYTSGLIDGVGAEATFQYPEAIAYDGHGSLYVADSGNRLVRRIWLASHAVSTYAGLPMHDGVTLGPLQSATFAFMHALTCTPSGGLLVASEQAVLSIVSQ